LDLDNEFIEYKGGNPVAFVLSANMHRRHLSQGQAAAIVAQAADWAKANKSGDNQYSERSAINSTPLSSIADRSDQSGASKATQRKADAVAKASPDLAKKVAHGEISLNKATEEVAPQLLNKKKQSAHQHDDAGYNPDADTIKELAHTVTELAEENERLKDAIAVGNLPDPERTAGEIIADLREQVRNLEINLKAVTDSRDSYMRDAKQFNDNAIYQSKRVKQLEKIVQQLGGENAIAA
jgi:hypothetical protein